MMFDQLERSQKCSTFLVLTLKGVDCRILASARVTVFPKVAELTLISITGAHTDIADIASLDYIVQSMHDLLLRGVRIQPMTCTGKRQSAPYVDSQLYPTLQDIDVI